VAFTIIKQEVLGRANRLLSLIRHGPHWKRRIQQFFYCCVCIRYSDKFSTEPLPSNDKGIFTEQLLNNYRERYTDKHTYTHTATWSHKPTLFFQNKESTLKIYLTAKMSISMYTYRVDLTSYTVLLVVYSKACASEVSKLPFFLLSFCMTWHLETPSYHLTCISPPVDTLYPIF
jgi:hypothetical protein